MSVPDELNLMRMLENRRREVMSLSQEVAKKLPKQASQRIPRHMRRRAASHQPSRVPRACRTKFLSCDKNSLQKERKRKMMKKHTHSMVHEASVKRRNQRTDRRTLHVWHAKRFRMQSLFTETEPPMSVPITNCTKNQRNLYRRAKSNNCFYYMTPITSIFNVCVQSLDELWRVIPNPSLSHHFHHMIYTAGRLVAPAEIIVVDATNVLISTHRLTAVAVTDYLKENGLTVCDGEHEYEERIRLIGPLAIDKISKFLSISLSFPSFPDASSCVRVEDMLMLKGNIGSRPFIDILLSSKACKGRWQLLVKNRSHLVGGLDNLKMLHFNAGQSFFPDFGFPDFPDPSVSMCRDPELRTLQGKSINLLEDKLRDMDDNALVPVYLLVQGKGNVCTDAVVTITTTGDAVASVDFGAYCLDKGCGKGMACLPAATLLRIIRNAESSGDANAKTLNCYIKNPLSDTHRLVSLHII